MYIDIHTNYLDALGVHEVVVEAVHGVVDGDVALPGEQQVPGVEAGVRVEDGEPARGVPLDQGPGDGAGAAVAGQQRRVETYRPENTIIIMFSNFNIDVSYLCWGWLTTSRGMNCEQ